MSLHTGSQKHPDRPRDPHPTPHVVLRDREEVHAVKAGVRTLHLAPTELGRRGRWATGDQAHLVRVQPHRRQDANFDPNEANTIREPGPTTRIVVTEFKLVTLGSLTLADSRLMFGKTGTLPQLRDWWLSRFDADWWLSTTDDTPWAAFDERWRSWAEWQVWRIRWKLDPRDRPRLLGQDGGPAYTTSPAKALRGADEAVEEWRQEGYADDAAPKIAEETRKSAEKAAAEETDLAARRSLAKQVAERMRKVERSKIKKALLEESRSAGGAS